MGVRLLALRDDGTDGDQQWEDINLPPQAEQEDYVKEGIWSKVKETAGKVPFMKDAIAMYYCAVDSKTPLRVKTAAFAALAYFILPADVVPDILPMVGFADDAGVVWLALQTINSHITDEHRQQAEDLLME